MNRRNARSITCTAVIIFILPLEALGTEDILGLTLGATVNDARTVLRMINPQLKISESRDRGWNALVIEAKNDNEVILIKFTETSGKAFFIGRSVEFAPGKRPIRAELNKDLISKYGKPSQQSGPGSFGGDFFLWAWASNGKQEFERMPGCAIGPNYVNQWKGGTFAPVFYQQNVATTCSKLIQANTIEPFGDNSKLAGGLSVAMTDFALARQDPKHPENAAMSRERRQIEDAKQAKPKL